MDNDPNTMLGTLSDNTMDFDLMDELFYDGCWLETTDGSNFWQPGLSISSPSNFSPHYLPSSETNMDLLDPIPYQRSFQERIRSNSGDNPPLIYPQMEELAGSSSQSKSFLAEGTEMSKRLWIGPGANLSPTPSMKKRFMQAFEYLKESTRDREVLIQVWVPIRSEGKRVLTTNDQPFSLNTNCKSLAGYRDVSRSYQFEVDEDSKEFVGLPGRVFLKQLPEWTPDVRFFRLQEYPRIKYAQQYNVSGSLALPVFEQGSGTCLGVVEIVTTTQKVNYRPELENICRALEAVDLRSSELLSLPKVKECDESYQAALAEIQEVLKSVCDAHKLPLAQTWAPCTQGKGGCRHSERNNSCCISIVDSACYQPNEEMMGFHEACSEHHLIKGEGVAGRALMTNQLCFATDITAFSKTEYPLSHHARMFELHAAVAIRLRSVYTGSADFILEFFLPLDCKDAEEQNRMVSSISLVLQRVSQSLRVITDQELDEDNAQKLLSSPLKEATRDESSWIAHMMEAQRKGKGVAVSLGCHKEEPEGEFKVITHWNNNEIELHDGSTFSELELNQRDSRPEGRAGGGGHFSSVGRHCPSGTRKVGEKRLTKTERTISLQVLRQYFSGSLKDAAKSIGVCPTTLKRICRQHGITRWPSRKIKKVDHSLRKLQRVIESVQGAEGAIQLSSFYTNFPQLSSPNLPLTSPFSTTNTNENLKQLNTQSEVRTLLLSPVTTPSKSPSSSGSHSSSSSFCCSTGAKQLSVSANASGRDPLSSEQPSEVLKRASSDAELHQSCILFGEHPSLETLPPLTKSSSQILRGVGAFRVKATFGEEKIRFSMPQNWGLQDLQGEIVSRFNVDDISKMDLKYMDDESEWILLTCDADLEECIDIHRSSRSRTIKLSLHQTSRLNLGSSFGSSGPS